MNQTQRNFLINELKERTKAKKEEIWKEKPEMPNLSTYVHAAVLAGTLTLKPHEVMLEELKRKAFNAKEGKDWLSEDRMGWEKSTTVKLPRDMFFDNIPGYDEALEEFRAKMRDLHSRVNALDEQLKSLTLRIQLASPSALANLIKEVDDMGQLSLVDNKLKLLM